MFTSLAIMGAPFCSSCWAYVHQPITICQIVAPLCTHMVGCRIPPIIPDGYILLTAENIVIYPLYYKVVPKFVS